MHVTTSRTNVQVVICKIFSCIPQEKNNDKSKIAYRIICNKSFAQEIMAGYTQKTCRAIDPFADKNTPYDLWH